MEEIEFKFDQNIADSMIEDVKIMLTLEINCIENKSPTRKIITWI